MVQRISGGLMGAVKGSISDGPWRSKSVLAALAVVLTGMAFWVNGLAKQKETKPPETQVAETPNAPTATAQPSAGKPIPGYVRWCASYIGGFFLGWGMRRFLKLTAVVALLIGGLIAMTKFTGCDTTNLSSRIERNVTAIRETAEKERVALKSLLPSATAATIGAFLGFRRKSRNPEPSEALKEPSN